MPLLWLRSYGIRGVYISNKLLLRPVSCHTSSHVSRHITYMKRRRNDPPPPPPKDTQEWKSATIIDEIFGDIEKIDLGNDTSEQWAPYASPHTKLAETPTEIKGITAMFLQRAFNKGIMRASNTVHSCELFDAYYFPPWHIVASGRKSRPAFTCLYHGGAQNNGVMQTTKPQNGRSHRSKNPMDYAVWRRKMKNLVRDCLFSGMQERNSRFADGLYVFRLKKFPTDAQFLETQVDKVIQKSVNVCLKEASNGWSNSSRRRFDVEEFDKMLKRMAYSPCPKTQPHEWQAIIENHSREAN